MSPEALRRILHAFNSDLHVACPGIVRSYNENAQVVEVQPAVQRVLLGEDPELDPDALEVLPILTSVPVLWLRAGGYFLHMPIGAGDTGVILFADTDIGAWRATGAVSDPGTDERHGLAGAIFVPGLHTRGAPIGSPGSSRLRMGKDGGPVLDITASNVDCGGTQALALASLVNQELIKVKATLDSLVGASFGVPYARATVDSSITRGA